LTADHFAFIGDPGERRQASAVVERLLREGEATLRGILDASSESIWLFAADGTVLTGNQTALARWGRPPDSVIGRRVQDLEPRNLMLSRFERISESARTGRVVEFEDVRAARRFHHTCYPVVDSQGIAARVAVFSRDITERSEAEEALRQSEERFRTLADNANAAISRLDRDGRFLYANPYYAKLVGLPPESIVGKTSQDLGRHLGHGAVVGRLRHVLDTGQPERFDWRSVEGRWWDVEYIPETHGGRETVLSIGRDITDRRRDEEALREANRQLEEADRRKNEFLAILSHELRNPLTPIHNGVHLLERAAPGSNEAIRALEVIRRQTHLLIHLVDDLLDVTRISRNKVRLQRRPLDLNAVVRRTVEDHRLLLEGKGIRVDTTLSASALCIDGDEARVAQVVGNLLQNAAKFTPAGGAVAVSTAVSGANAMAVIEVADTGVGMEPSLVGRLFEPFAQAERTLDRAESGLGLGLALVKSLTELHGGRVRAHSDGPGAGSTFVVELPLGEALAAPDDAVPAVVPPARLRVLVIEDNPDAADMLATMLDLNGHDVRVAHDGASGLAAARVFLPDVVLCDIGLPGMDGLEVAKAFRADARLDRIALVALSGYALEDDLRRAAEAGFDRHVAKPASPETIEQVLVDLVGARPDRHPGRT
jgi:PAS domain S-box-containing protein